MYPSSTDNQVLPQQYLPVQPLTFTLKDSPVLFRIYISAAVFLTLLGGWLLYELTVGKPFLSGFLLVIGVAAIAFSLALQSRSTVLSFANGNLARNNLFVHQSVQLPYLIKAEFVASFGKFPVWKLRLQDTNGGIVRFDPTDYAPLDRNLIIETLKPYVFTEQVYKNFTQLDSWITQPSDSAQSAIHNVGRIIIRTFLFVLLPGLIITGALFIWAYITQQPGF